MKMTMKERIIIFVLVCTYLCIRNNKTPEEQVKLEISDYLENIELSESSEGTIFKTSDFISYTTKVTNGDTYKAVYNMKTKEISIERVKTDDDVFSYTKNDVLGLLYENGYAKDKLILKTLYNCTDNLDTWKVITKEDTELCIHMESGIVEEQE